MELKITAASSCHCCRQTSLAVFGALPGPATFMGFSVSSVISACKTIVILFAAVVGLQYDFVRFSTLAAAKHCCSSGINKRSIRIIVTLKYFSATRLLISLKSSSDSIIYPINLIKSDGIIYNPEISLIQIVIFCQTRFHVGY